MGLNACEKNKTKLTSPLILAPAQLPKMPKPSAYNINNGIISVAAQTRVTTKKRIGLVDETSMASICSVTFMEPSSAPMPELIFPAQIKAVMTGPISRISETATMPGSKDSAPKLINVGLDWMVNTRPMMNPVMEMSGKVLYPI